MPIWTDTKWIKLHCATDVPWTLVPLPCQVDTPAQEPNISGSP